ncbi:MAG TPA: hypothetical protein VK666_20305, partial [Chryseolinea sp.]|nr:hypothetical protein [Chryseolinea sp.]
MFNAKLIGFVGTRLTYTNIGTKAPNTCSGLSEGFLVGSYLNIRWVNTCLLSTMHINSDLNDGIKEWGRERPPTKNQPSSP